MVVAAETSSASSSFGQDRAEFLEKAWAAVQEHFQELRRQCHGQDAISRSQIIKFIIYDNVCYNIWLERLVLASCIRGSSSSVVDLLTYDLKACKYLARIPEASERDLSHGWLNGSYVRVHYAGGSPVVRGQHSGQLLMSVDLDYVKDREITDAWYYKRKAIEEFEWDTVDIKLTIGPPCSGKTQSAKTGYLASAGGLLLTYGKARVLELVATEKLDYTSCRTYDSVLSYGSSDDVFDKLWGDEALSVHPGDVLMCVLMVKATKVHLFGDRQMMKFSYRGFGYTTDIPFTLADASTVEEQPVSYKLPKCMVSLLESYYPNASTLSNVSGKVYIMEFKNSTSLPTQIAPFEAAITFTEAEAKALAGNEYPVYTIDQARTRSFTHVMVFRLIKSNLPIFDSLSHILVAITRHSGTIAYRTVRADDTLSKILKPADTSATLNLLKDITNVTLKYHLLDTCRPPAKILRLSMSLAGGDVMEGNPQSGDLTADLTGTSSTESIPNANCHEQPSLSSELIMSLSNREDDSMTNIGMACGDGVWERADSLPTLHYIRPVGLEVSIVDRFFEMFIHSIYFSKAVKRIQGNWSPETVSFQCLVSDRTTPTLKSHTVLPGPKSILFEDRESACLVNVMHCLMLVLRSCTIPKWVVFYQMTLPQLTMSVDHILDTSRIKDIAPVEMSLTGSFRDPLSLAVQLELFKRFSLPYKYLYEWSRFYRSKCTTVSSTETGDETQILTYISNTIVSLMVLGYVYDVRLAVGGIIGGCYATIYHVIPQSLPNLYDTVSKQFNLRLSFDVYPSSKCFLSLFHFWVGDEMVVVPNPVHVVDYLRCEACKSPSPERIQWLHKALSNDFDCLLRFNSAAASLTKALEERHGDEDHLKNISRIQHIVDLIEQYEVFKNTYFSDSSSSRTTSDGSSSVKGRSQN